MSRTRTDTCVYMMLSAMFAGAFATFVVPFFAPDMDTLWVTICAAIIGMLIAMPIIALQDRSHAKKYRGEAK